MTSTSKCLVRFAVFTRALAAVLRLGSLMKRRGRDVDAVVRRLAVPWL